MAVIGTATLNIVPKMKGSLTDAVKEQLSAAESAAGSKGASAGSAFSAGFGGGAAKAGILFSAASAVATKAMDVVAEHVGAAASRFDTLNNYPTVMQSLGYETDEVSASLGTMDSHLQGLPTSLSDMVTLVQGLSTTTGDLTQATNAGLALNDMLVASGSSTQLTTAAMEQFRQILAKGKPEMEDWRSLTSAMPGQMDQLAKSMLGPTANANDLYAALGGGKNEATLSMDDLLEAMIRLDTEGGEGFASFAEQAKSASGGIESSMANLSTAVNRGIAGTLEAIGRDSISDAFSGARSAVDAAFSGINSAVSGAMPAVKSFGSLLAGMAPAALSAAAAFEVASRATTAWTGKDKAFESLSKAIDESVSSGKLAAAGVGAAAAVAVAAYALWKQHADRVKAATEGLSDAVGKAEGLSDYASKLTNVGESAAGSKKSVDELMESIGKHAEAMSETAEKAQSEITTLNTAKSIIDQYAGSTDLTADAQGRLQWAVQTVNDQLGTSITVADAMSDTYRDAEGNVSSLRDAIDGLIEKKKEEIRVEAYHNQLSEAYSAQTEAAQGVVQAERDLAAAQERLNDSTLSPEEVTAANIAYWAAKDNLDKMKSSADSANDSVNRLETMLGSAAAEASSAATIYDQWASSLDSGTRAAMDARLDGKGGLSALKESLEQLGVTHDGLAEMGKHDVQELANAYDGSTASIVGKLSEWGVQMDEAKASTAQAASDMRSAIEGMPEVASKLSDSGVDVDNFAQKLADAGVSAETLRATGSENLSKLADECGDDMGAMVGAIVLYNSVPLVNKDGTVNVNDAKLVDGLGNVYTWNGEYLADKYGNAAVNDTSVHDATGALWTWNGAALVDKDSTAVVVGNVATGEAKSRIDDVNDSMEGLPSSVNPSVNVGGNFSSAVATIWELGRAIGSLTDKVVNVFTNKYENDYGSGNAAGGIRLNAAGGYRLHAAGAIATKAVPLDIVGEAGAEAIVPLTNERYSRPFAEQIARQMDESSGRGDVTVNVYAQTGAAQDIALAVRREIESLAATGVM